jgi:hypothetical protein
VLEVNREMIFGKRALTREIPPMWASDSVRAEPGHSPCSDASFLARS